MYCTATHSTSSGSAADATAVPAALTTLPSNASAGPYVLLHTCMRMRLWLAASRHSKWADAACSAWHDVMRRVALVRTHQLPELPKEPNTAAEAG